MRTPLRPAAFAVLGFVLSLCLTKGCLGTHYRFVEFYVDARPNVQAIRH